MRRTLSVFVIAIATFFGTQAFSGDFGLIKDKQIQIFQKTKKKANQGIVEEQYLLGILYLNGEGVPQDYEKAFKWLHAAGKQGMAAAQTWLGEMYYNGKGVSQDYDEAAKWFHKGAKQGDIAAQTWLGEMYHSGKGVSQDYDEAARLFRKGAKQGKGSAQFYLGEMYFDGKGVPQDYDEAYFWLNLAVASGMDYISEVRDRAAEKLTRKTLEKVQKRTRKWQPQK